MKTKNKLSSLLMLSMILAFGFNSMAQKAQGMMMQGHPMRAGSGFNQERQMNNFAFLKLTDEQKTKMAEMRIALTAKNLPLKNQLGEMRAKMHTLQTGDNQDIKAISKLIDEMSNVRAQMAKIAAEHKIAVRALLTDDQKVMFDARQGKQRNTQQGMHRKSAGMRGDKRQPRPGFNQ